MNKKKILNTKQMKKKLLTNKQKKIKKSKKAHLKKQKN